MSKTAELDVPFDRVMRNMCALSYLRDLVNTRTHVKRLDSKEGLEGLVKAKPLKTGLWQKSGSK
jgi:hypothetical protein